MISLLLSLVLTTGCRSDKDVEDTAPAPLADDDNDGFTEDVDCDDLDASVNPDATEIWYDGVDSDCRGDSDLDQDGDGEITMEFGGNDCDDTDPNVIECLDTDTDTGTDAPGDSEDPGNCGGCGGGLGGGLWVLGLMALMRRRDA